MLETRQDDAAREVLAFAHPLSGTEGDFDPLLDLIGDAPFVLLGEASHGTHEFYRARAAITERLVARRASRPWRSKPTGPMLTA